MLIRKLDRLWDLHKTCIKLAEADSGCLWRLIYIHSEFWLLRKALIELQKRLANPYTRSTLRRGLFWRLYPSVWSSFNQHAGILSSLVYIFLLVACNVTVLLSTMSKERVRRQTDIENLFIFGLHFWVFRFQTGCWPSSFRSKTIWRHQGSRFLYSSHNKLYRV